MRAVLMRFGILGILCGLFAVVLMSHPAPVHACVCLHWTGLGSQCDRACGDGYHYCLSNPHGNFQGCCNVQGPCISGEFSSIDACDRAFDCVYCAQWSSDCGGGL